MKLISFVFSFRNEEKNLKNLVDRDDKAVKKTENRNYELIFVNDASTEANPGLSNNLDNLSYIKLINMKENRGHARCNAVGLKHIFANEEFDYVIPMDGDGEDRPEEIKKLVNNLNYHPDKPIVGERIKRSEGFFFKFC